MLYLLLIYSEEPNAAPDPELEAAVMSEYWAYESALAEAGVKRGGNALQASSTAHTVRIKAGERVVSEGPATRGREVVEGYYLLDLPDTEAALDWAARCPASRYGTVEVRPVLEFAEVG